MKQTKRILSAALALLLILLSLSACDAHSQAGGGTVDPQTADTVYLAIEDYGVVTIKLYEKKAPITVANFKKLVADGFYDGLTFHRVIEGFVIQGGDPEGDGTGGSDETITGEFKVNGHDTGIKHVEGTISMARSGSPYESYYYAGYDVPAEYLTPAFNSASSQFFIVTETSENNTAALDGKYAAFGRVTDGMDIVKKISSVVTDEDDKPVVTVRIAIATFDKSMAEAALKR